VAEGNVGAQSLASAAATGASARRSTGAFNNDGSRPELPFVAAGQKVSPVFSATWQRCRVHF